MKFLVNEKIFPRIIQVGLALMIAVSTGAAAASPEEDYKVGAASHRIGDIVGAMTPLKRAADQGYAPAQALYGSILDSAELDDEAVAYLRKAVAQDDLDGMFFLAHMYLSGDATPPEPEYIGQLLREAARKGHKLATSTLAISFIRGSTIAGADDLGDSEIVALIISAAEGGNVTSVEALIDAYQSGSRFGLAADPGRVTYWTDYLKKLREQANQGGGRK